MTDYETIRKDIYESFHDTFHKLYISELKDQIADKDEVITTLRAEVETVGAMHRDACELAKHRMQEVERLRATNERLRALLNEAADDLDDWGAYSKATKYRQDDRTTK